MRRLVLASASPARLATLRAAGLDPEVVVSGVDESGVRAGTPAELVAALARLKGKAVADRLGSASEHEAGTGDGRVGYRGGPIVLGCDSMLELDGQAYGKPRDAAAATERWLRMRGRSGILRTGHHLTLGGRSRTAVASTVVHFAALSDEEIAAYVATGEPLDVAGAFTVDGLGGPFVSGIEGDYHNVVGLSLPLLRTMLAELGVSWPSLWA